jgi:vacuolar-type H+-ATPase subunit D/Vma8
MAATEVDGVFNFDGVTAPLASGAVGEHSVEPDLTSSIGGGTSSAVPDAVTAQLARQAQLITELQSQSTGSNMYGLTPDQIADNKDMIPVITNIAKSIADASTRVALVEIRSTIESLTRRINQIESGTKADNQDRQSRARNNLSSEVNRLVAGETGVSGVLAKIGKLGELYTQYTEFCAQYSDLYKTRTNFQAIEAAVANLDASAISAILSAFVKSTQIITAGTQTTDGADSVVTATIPGVESAVLSSPVVYTPQQVEDALAKYQKLVDSLTRKKISQEQFDAEYKTISTVLNIE